MANDERPALWWDPGWLQSSAPMTGEGEIPGSPFANLDTALDAVRRRRAANAGDASPRDNVYLVTYAPRRWVVFDLKSPVQLGNFFDSADTSSLPMAVTKTPGKLGKV